jgi:hydroxymethylglutaryl-CoA reductase
LVGGEDTHVLELNSSALQIMGASDSSQIVVVPGAGHLFEGPGQLEEVAELAVQWFRGHMECQRVSLSGAEC